LPSVVLNIELVDFVVGTDETTDTGSMVFANFVRSTAPLARLAASTMSGPRSMPRIVDVPAASPLVPPAGLTLRTPSLLSHLIHSRHEVDGLLGCACTRPVNCVISVASPKVGSGSPCWTILP
jgi:hypothetical protein